MGREIEEEGKGGGAGGGGEPPPTEQHHEETHKRAIVKAATYRAIVAITLAAISWYYTGDIFETSAVSITYTILATIVYYLHERAWLKVKWGTKKN